eukprot:TRINITY_DN1924_c0_g1_i1.p1 TRINITY_DN1924_c0_g1~~TRINITY_DN1924_c0_g1_i1.p1  ORF type:complete len:215 (+),score=74.61 TRINITY_DN1924_c0_g1_i1:56-700(+)
MAPVTFTYFGLMAKGFGPIMCLETHGVEWVGKSVAFENWPDMKKSGVCPFGQLPILECEHGVVAQSQTAMRYVARKVPAADGKDDKEGTVSDMLLGLSDDLYDALAKAQPSLLAPKKDMEGVNTFWNETLPGKLAYVESFLKGKDAFTTTGVTIGELALWCVMHMMTIVGPTCLDKTPNTKAFYTRILNLPSTQKVISGKTSFGELPSFFVKAE